VVELGLAVKARLHSFTLTSLWFSFSVQ
jgi:hypothetical protein